MPSPSIKDAWRSRRRRVPERSRRGGVLGELALALLPTLTVLGVLFFVEALVRQRLLFASLASSAFLIYRAPEHRMNSARVMVSAQLIAVAVGIAAARLLTPGYVAAGVAMGGAILLLIVCDVVHPPAILTALDPTTKDLVVLGTIVILRTVLNFFLGRELAEEQRIVGSAEVGSQAAGFASWLLPGSTTGGTSGGAPRARASGVSSPLFR